MNLEQLNHCPEEAAQHFFEQACCAPRWIAAMTNARPFANSQALLQTAEAQWQTMRETDWLAAFEGHPRIGDVATLDKRFANTRATASHEQSGVETATQEVLEELLRLNQLYADRFGFIFIVCASGKSAAEMLALLQARIDNEREDELRIAAGEQWKITALRLQKQLQTSAPAQTSAITKAPITTHILDQTRGKPAVGIPVTLQRENPSGNGMSVLGVAATDADGRITHWSVPLELQQGVYQLLFDLSGSDTHGEFFPRIQLTFAVKNPEQHYHVPLLLSPYGYSTYRGS